MTMPRPDRVARRHYERQQVRAAAAAATAREAWSSVDPSNVAASWAAQVPDLTVEVTRSQVLAAGAAEGYVEEALTIQGVDAAPFTAVRPAGFAGVASDGRPLPTLLAQPAITTIARIGGGATVAEALDSGLAALITIVSTQVTDAGRVAVGVAVAARPRTGYVRMLSTPSCSRCVVLAGKFFRWNDGFQRHPRCDCQHIPVAENVSGDLTTDPAAYFRSLGRPEQDRIFTNAGAEAIRDGADIGQVVNARRGMSSAGFTTEGVTRVGRTGPLGRAGQSLGRTGRNVRLTPERIYELAGDDRAVAIDLLRQHGYAV